MNGVTVYIPSCYIVYSVRYLYSNCTQYSVPVQVLYEYRKYLQTVVGRHTQIPLQYKYITLYTRNVLSRSLHYKYVTPYSWLHVHVPVCLY